MKFPLVKRSGSVSVVVYRVKHKTAAGGFVYTVSWIEPGVGRRTRQFADVDEACDEAQLKADQLARGVVSTMSISDAQELTEARRIAGEFGVVPALEQWSKWRTERKPERKRIQLKAAVEDFISAKVAAGKQEKTYRSKLNSLAAALGDVYVDTIDAPTLTKWLNTIVDPVTRNDHRKRAGTLFRWLRRQGYLPRGVETEVDHTDKAKEEPVEIGILEPAAYRECLCWLREHRPGLLAAAVIAGLCGVRSDEIHGKRGDGREKRQLWEDIDLRRGTLFVTNAKTNTPARRMVPLYPAAVEWLKVCPGNHEGPVCGPGDMEGVRRFLIAAGFSLPENCFRHSYITYDIALHENKAATALRAGNSVQEIDRRYRVPRSKADGRRWFSTRPTDDAATPRTRARRSGAPGR